MGKGRGSPAFLCAILHNVVKFRAQMKAFAHLFPLKFRSSLWGGLRVNGQSPCRAPQSAKLLRLGDAETGGMKHLIFYFGY